MTPHTTLDALAAPMGYTVLHTEATTSTLGSYTLQTRDGSHVVIITPYVEDIEHEISLLAESDVWELKRGTHVSKSGTSAVVDMDGEPTEVSGDIVSASRPGGSIVLTRRGDEPKPLGAWTKAPVRTQPIIKVE